MNSFKDAGIQQNTRKRPCLYPRLPRPETVPASDNLKTLRSVGSSIDVCQDVSSIAHIDNKLVTLTFNVTQTAEILGFSRHTVNSMCKSFELPFIPRGKKGRRISLLVINEWIKKNTAHNLNELKRIMDKRRKGGSHENDAR